MVEQPTAWRLGHAIRLLMARHTEPGARLTGTVEVDTKRIGGAPRWKQGVKNKRGKGSNKPIMLVAANRHGQSRAAVIVTESSAEMGPMLDRFIDPSAGLMSDADAALIKLGRGFAAHQTVTHGDREYVRGIAHTNNADQLGQQLERAKLGVLHHMSRPHLQRYVDEIVFRWNQRTITSDYLSRGQLKERRVPRPFLAQLGDLFGRAIGCELRRARGGGITTPAASRVAVATTQPEESVDWSSLGLGGFDLMPMATA